MEQLTLPEGSQFDASSEEVELTIPLEDEDFEWLFDPFTED